MDEPTKQVAFRLPLAMVARLDGYVEYLRERNPGLGATRADAARVLLTQALDSHEQSQPSAAKPKRK